MKTICKNNATISSAILMIAIAGCGGGGAGAGGAGGQGGAPSGQGFGWYTAKDADTPWVAPGRQAVEKRKEHSGWNNSTYESVWIDASGKSLRDYDVMRQVETYYLKIGYTAKVSDDLANGKHVPSAIVVSIDPIVVILSPPNLAQVKMGALVRGTGGVNYSNSKNGGTLMTGSKWFYNDGLQWLSPDLNQEATEIEFTKAGTAEIPLPKGKLKLVREGEIFKVTRE